MDEYLQENEIGFNASFIVGGQIGGEPLRLFRIYAEGNFIEAGLDTPYFQTGETKYGKPIIDRVITRCYPAGRGHEMRTGVIRFNHALQPVRGHAHRPDLLRTGQPRSADALPLRRWGCLFHRAKLRMERRYAAGISAIARAALVTAADRVSDCFLISCEHGGNRIPASYRALFDGYRCAAQLPSRLRSRCAGDGEGTGHRLQGAARGVDHQPPAHRPQSLDSAIPSSSPRRRAVPQRRCASRLSRRYYRPYRVRVERLVRQAVARRRRVIHISSHSFTGELDGKVRHADVGLLYHPARRGEGELCARWKAVARGPGSGAPRAPQLSVRRERATG